MLGCVSAKMTEVDTSDVSSPKTESVEKSEPVDSNEDSKDTKPEEESKIQEVSNKKTDSKAKESNAQVIEAEERKNPWRTVNKDGNNLHF